MGQRPFRQRCSRAALLPAAPFPAALFSGCAIFGLRYLSMGQRCDSFGWRSCIHHS